MHHGGRIGIDTNVHINAQPFSYNLPATTHAIDVLLRVYFLGRVGLTLPDDPTPVCDSVKKTARVGLGDARRVAYGY